MLDDVTSLAGLNHQPTRRETWMHNQESGYFGELVGRLQERANPET